jgi:hypothetical protein
VVSGYACVLERCPSQEPLTSSCAVQNPTEWSAALLLGLEAINASKDEANHPEAERVHLFVTGTKYVERAFKASNQRTAAAANALCEVFLRKGALDRVRSDLANLAFHHSCC